jgi:hypothetical protein
MYLWHFRLGQLFGAGFFLYSVYTIGELVKLGHLVPAYTLGGIFALLTLVIFTGYRKDKASSMDRRNNNTHNNHRKSFTPHHHADGGRPHGTNSTYRPNSRGSGSSFKRV